MVRGNRPQLPSLSNWAISFPSLIRSPSYAYEVFRCVVKLGGVISPELSKVKASQSSEQSASVTCQCLSVNDNGSPTGPLYHKTLLHRYVLVTASVLIRYLVFRVHVILSRSYANISETLRGPDGLNFYWIVLDGWPLAINKNSQNNGMHRN